MRENNEELLKRLKNIENKTDKQLKEDKDSQLGVKYIGYAVKQELSQEAKNMLDKLNNQEKLLNYKKRSFKGGNNVDYDFSNFSSIKELHMVTCLGETFIPAAERF